LKLNQVEYLVLAKPTACSDMGFINDIRKIVGKTPIKRQTLFSRHHAEGHRRPCEAMLRDPARVA